MTSAEVCGPRPGGYTVSNSRFRRAENVVLIDMTSGRLVNLKTASKYLLTIVARVNAATKYET
jgi:hypothetical protein